MPKKDHGQNKDHGHNKDASENAQSADQGNAKASDQGNAKAAAKADGKQKHHHGHYTGDTVNLLVDVVNNLVTEVFTNSQTQDTGCEFVNGVTSFTDANSCLYQQGFRIVASLNDDDGAVYTYVR